MLPEPEGELAAGLPGLAPRRSLEVPPAELGEPLPIRLLIQTIALEVLDHDRRWRTPADVQLERAASGAGVHFARLVTGEGTRARPLVIVP